MEVSRIVVVNDENSPMSYLVKATQAARDLDRARSMGDADPQDAVTTLRQFEDLLCKPLALETAKATSAISTETEAARASAALGLAADYCEHAAETIERVRQLALGSANSLSKEVPMKVAAWRGELQSKAIVKANPPKSLPSGYSSLFGSKKTLTQSEPKKDLAGQAGSSPPEEIIKRVSEEDLTQGRKVNFFFFDTYM